MSQFLKNKTLILPDGTVMDGNPADFLAGKFVAYYCTKMRRTFNIFPLVA